MRCDFKAQGTIVPELRTPVNDYVTKKGLFLSVSILATLNRMANPLALEMARLLVLGILPLADEVFSVG